MDEFFPSMVGKGTLRECEPGPSGLQEFDTNDEIPELPMLSQRLEEDGVVDQHEDEPLVYVLDDSVDFASEPIDCGTPTWNSDLNTSRPKSGRFYKKVCL